MPVVGTWPQGVVLGWHVTPLRGYFKRCSNSCYPACEALGGASVCSSADERRSSLPVLCEPDDLDYATHM
jgi:hypothetical protein